MIKMCNSCKDEFLPKMTVCPTCDQKLVSTFEHSVHASFVNEQKEQVKPMQDPQIFIESGLDSCKEIARILQKNKINTFLAPDKSSCADDGDIKKIGSHCSAKYYVMVEKNDFEKASLVLKDRFEAQVNKEGKGKFVLDAIDLASENIVCPACNEQVTINNGECSSCGLFVGVPEL